MKIGIRLPLTDQTNAVTFAGIGQDHVAINMLSVLISTAYSLASIVNVCVSVLFAGSVSYVVVSTTATIS